MNKHKHCLNISAIQVLGDGTFLLDAFNGIDFEEHSRESAKTQCLSVAGVVRWSEITLLLDTRYALSTIESLIKTPYSGSYTV